jgi:hypothetical protein
MVLSLSLLISIPIQPLFSFRLAGTRSPPFPLVGPFLSRPSSHHNPCCGPTSSPLPPLLSFWPSRPFFFSLASLLSRARLWPSSHTRPTKQPASLAPPPPFFFLLSADRWGPAVRPSPNLQLQLGHLPLMTADLYPASTAPPPSNTLQSTRSEAGPHSPSSIPSVSPP